MPPRLNPALSNFRTNRTPQVGQTIAKRRLPMSADAAKLSEADKVALKQATVACKAEMKDKKIRWPKSRAYLSECLREALKDHPNIKIPKLDPRFEVRG